MQKIKKNNKIETSDAIFFEISNLKNKIAGKEKRVINIRLKANKPTKFKIPIICVGNIYLGGTGKTPLSIFLAKEFEIRGKNPVIVRKYYKNHSEKILNIEQHIRNKAAHSPLQ